MSRIGRSLRMGALALALSLGYAPSSPALAQELVPQAGQAQAGASSGGGLEEIAGEGKARKPKPTALAAPFSTLDYQGAMPARTQNRPTYSDANMNELLRQRAEDPMGLPGYVGREQAEYTLDSLLRMVPRVMVSNMRGEQTGRVSQVVISPYSGTDVFGTATVMQHQRNGFNNSVESRLQFTIGQGSKSKLATNGRPIASARIVREEIGSTLVNYDPASSNAAVNNPAGGLNVRYRTSVDGSAPIYAWVNNASNAAQKCEAKTAAAPGPRQENILPGGTPWLTEGDYSAFQLLQQSLQVGMWNGNAGAPRYYDTINVLTRAEGGYQNGGVNFQLHSFAVDWAGGKPAFIPGHVTIDLKLNYGTDGKVGTLEMAVNGESDFQGSAGIGVAPLRNPAANEKYATTDARVIGVQYNWPGGGQLARTADMAAIVKGVKNTGNAGWGVLPYSGR